ncbi:MAG TPA: YdeI/OmpD-associated family protein [Thermoplasmata archaeon]|jgi:hypothetical protein
MSDISFTAKLEAMGPKGAWVFLYLPKEASEKLGSRGRVPVTGSMNGFSFRSSAFPRGDGTHQIAVNKAMQAGAKANPGDTVKVVLRVDTGARGVDVPADLKKAFASSAAAKANFEKMAWSHRKGYVDWIQEAKRPETRAKRIQEAVTRMARGQGFYD